jgi:hypothetical protein
VEWHVCTWCSIVHLTWGNLIATKYFTEFTAQIALQKFVLSMNSYQAEKLLLSWIILHCPLWPVWLYHTFPHLVKAPKKNVWNIKCVFWLFVQLLSEIFLLLRRIQQYFFLKYL